MSKKLCGSHKGTIISKSHWLKLGTVACGSPFVLSDNN